MRISVGLKLAVAGVDGHEVQEVLGVEEPHNDGGAIIFTVRNDCLCWPFAKGHVVAFRAGSVFP
jgi:hypothetical protein